MKEGLITKVGYDPEDNAKVIYLQKRLDGQVEPQLNMNEAYSMTLGNDIHRQVPILFNKMQKLSAEGWVATQIVLDRTDFKLIWHPKQHIERTPTKKRTAVSAMRQYI